MICADVVVLTLLVLKPPKVDNGLSAEVDYSRPLGGECCRLYSLLTEVA